MKTEIISICYLNYYRFIYKIFITIIILFGFTTIFAQNIAPSSLYAFDKFNVNNAYGGLTGNRILSLNVREQWVNLPGYPRYYHYFCL